MNVTLTVTTIRKFLFYSFVIFALIGFTIAPFYAHSQQPQTQTAPLFSVNAKYTNGVAPGFYTTAGSGLTVNVGGGTSFCGGVVQEIPPTALTLSPSTTNYIYLDTTSNCALTTSTTTFTVSDIPISIVVTGGSNPLSITDVRTIFNASNALPLPIQIAQGGTGATTGAQALINLGTEQISHGGTGQTSGIA